MRSAVAGRLLRCIRTCKSANPLPVTEVFNDVGARNIIGGRAPRRGGGGGGGGGQMCLQHNKFRIARKRRTSKLLRIFVVCTLLCSLCSCFKRSLMPLASSCSRVMSAPTCQSAHKPTQRCMINPGTI